MAEKMSQLLKQYAVPVVWKFTSGKYRTLIKWQKEKCCDSCREAQSYPTCWAMATTYQTLLVILQYSQGEESRARGSEATQTAPEPEQQPMPVAAAPVQKKKFKNKSIHMVRDEKKPGPSKPEEETSPDIHMGEP